MRQVLLLTKNLKAWVIATSQSPTAPSPTECKGPGQTPTEAYFLPRHEIGVQQTAPSSLRSQNSSPLTTSIISQGLVQEGEFPVQQLLKTPS
jgi:hypothetical protein